jgi:hypothetical protein
VLNEIQKFMVGTVLSRSGYTCVVLTKVHTQVHDGLSGENTQTFLSNSCSEDGDVSPLVLDLGSRVTKVCAGMLQLSLTATHEERHRLVSLA